MCMIDAVKIESKDVPEFGYKVYCVTPFGDLYTPYFSEFHQFNKWNKSNEKKKSHHTVIHMPSALHFGRICIFKHKNDAFEFKETVDRENSIVVKVKTKQTTKYAYEGFNGYVRHKKSYVVDMVKPIEKVN